MALVIDVLPTPLVDPAITNLSILNSITLLVFYLNGFNHGSIIILVCEKGISIMAIDGLVIVYTGGGKGKTTAALGMALRAIGYDHKVCMIQFIKGSWHYGEMDSSKKLAPEFELVAIGKGFVGILDDTSPKEDHEKYAEEAIKICKDKILSEKYDLIILDEINYAVNLGLINIKSVVDLIKLKPKKLDLVLTGNHAKEEVLELADLVTEMKEVKHPFQSGIKAKKGIDF
jgi:cob(I)alamin adenosyltransferase